MRDAFIYLFIDILLGDSLINYDFNSIGVGLFCHMGGSH